VLVQIHAPEIGAVSTEKKPACPEQRHSRKIHHPDPFSDGTTHVIFDPLDFIAKLVSLVPKPRVNLTRFHGVFVGVPHHPNSKHRILVTPARRGKGGQKVSDQDKTDGERRAAMTWAQRLKRVFNIDVETCTHCGGPVKVIACIEDQQVIDKILSHLKKKDGLPSHTGLVIQLVCMILKIRLLY
jgi:hypothetical protein